MSLIIVLGFSRGGSMIRRFQFGCGVLALAAVLGVPWAGSAQRPGPENGEWRYLGGDAGNTRSAPLLDQSAQTTTPPKMAPRLLPLPPTMSMMKT